jgi:hypothetical protein
MEIAVLSNSINLNVRRHWPRHVILQLTHITMKNNVGAIKYG